MSDQRMTRVEFLTARIDEDEEVAREAATRPIQTTYLASTQRRDVTPDHLGVVWYIDPGWSSPHDSGTFRQGEAHFERFNPTRVLAECEAKRRIVALWREQPNVFAEVMATVAGVYSDHADYDETWRP